MRFYKKEIESVIRIFKEKIPYKFEVEGFKFEIFENVYSGDIYIIGRDSSGDLLGTGAEKLILDFPLFWYLQEDEKGNRDSRYPRFNLVPRSVDGKEYKINLENIGEKILLSYEVGDAVI